METNNNLEQETILNVLFLDFLTSRFLDSLAKYLNTIDYF